MSSKITSFTSQLDKVLSDTYTNFRGRLIERINAHSFRVGKNYYPTLEEAKKGVEASIQILAKSIRHV